MRRGLSDFGLNGRAALEAVISASVYGSPEQAVASLTLFSHPDTVRQTGGSALFPCIRSLGRHDRRTFVERDGARVGLDDNATAHAAFAWSNGLRRRGTDVQLNHVYARRDDACAFTSLANLCLGPSFLAKLTDHSPRIGALLRRRVFDLYGWSPEDEPERPDGYEALEWAAPLPPVPALEVAVRARMATQPSHFATCVAREIGWFFSGGAPDATLALQRVR